MGLFAIPVPLHDQQQRFVVGSFVGGHGRLGARSHLIPNLAPHYGRGLAERPGMFAADDRLIGVVVEIDQLVAPPDEHGLARGEHDADRGPKRLRPGFDGAQGSARPIHGTHQLAQFPAAGEKAGTGVRCLQ